MQTPTCHVYRNIVASISSSPVAPVPPDGDHLVGWANSSLRFMHQLPRLPPGAQAAKGVVLQVGRGRRGETAAAVLHA